MPRAVSKIVSVTIAIDPSAGSANPTAAQDASCHLDGVALMDPQALATPDRSDSKACRGLKPATAMPASGKVAPPQAELPTRNSIEPNFLDPALPETIDVLIGMELKAS